MKSDQNKVKNCCFRRSTKGADWTNPWFWTIQNQNWISRRTTTHLNRHMKKKTIASPKRKTVKCAVLFCTVQYCYFKQLLFGKNYQKRATWPLTKICNSYTNFSCLNWFQDFLLVKQNSFATIYSMNCQNKPVLAHDLYIKYAFLKKPHLL